MADEAIWRPSEERIASARITDYAKWLERERGLSFASYERMWQWSTSDLEGFWRSLWDYFDLRSTQPPVSVLARREMPGAQWFPEVRMNYAAQVLRHAKSERPAIVFGNERGDRVELSWRDLERQVGALAAALRELGVGQGDRVVAYCPNIAQTVVAFLATASLGAVWSVCSPDMGPVAVLDRFRQIAPKLLIAVDGYQYGGRRHDRHDLVAELLRELPSLEHLVLIPYLDPVVDSHRYPGALLWNDLLAWRGVVQPLPLPFDHPLWVVYSSGTTGAPKAIVHGHGGIVLEHLKLNALHLDLGATDRYHWFSSTGWVMWNAQVGGLLVGATICLYDGNPGWPDLAALWRFVGEARVSAFGAGAAFFASCFKAEVKPTQVANLGALRTLGSTGSPLSDECYRWVYEQLPAEVWLAPISGGTDFAGAFVVGNPTLPVYVGEMQCRALGASVEAFDEQGRALIDVVGELVCTAPMPSMPLYFWNDADGSRYRDSYFDMYPGVWRHGDWLRITSRGGAIIYGRSDATINRHGIRMGTAELYRAVEVLPEVLDSLVLDLEYLGRESYMPLFVVLREGCVLDDALRARMVEGIRCALSPRHVPSEILQIAEVPRTLSGKKLELPVKKLLMGQAVDKVLNRDAMANPASLDWFTDFAARRGPAA